MDKERSRAGQFCMDTMEGNMPICKCWTLDECAMYMWQHSRPNMGEACKLEMRVNVFSVNDQAPLHCFFSWVGVCIQGLSRFVALGCRPFCLAFDCFYQFSQGQPTESHEAVVVAHTPLRIFGDRVDVHRVPLKRQHWAHVAACLHGSHPILFRQGFSARASGWAQLVSHCFVANGCGPSKKGLLHDVAVGQVPRMQRVLDPSCTSASLGDGDSMGSASSGGKESTGISRGQGGWLKPRSCSTVAVAGGTWSAVSSATLPPSPRAMSLMLWTWGVRECNKD